ncbi:unnamed protein product [Heligmosomoides polygyrus]|uniref:Uncharacterized protein n=1 Tax=Heligmosomoides polygyrus TaxID=6339 RepID=A0A183GHM7_HELPZ|nr:unnamed protein product [Heligmosomoides polygyrus]
MRTPLDAVPSREEIKLAKRIAGILQDFELRQLEIDELEKLEVVEEEDQEFRPEEECAGVATTLTSEGTITFSGGHRFGGKGLGCSGVPLGRNCEAISTKKY